MNYYDHLGVGKDASPEDLKAAYKKNALKYHPDLNKESDAEERMKEINEAYAVLSDEIARQNYDASLPANIEAESEAQTATAEREQTVEQKRPQGFASFFGNPNYRPGPPKTMDEMINEAGAAMNKILKEMGLGDLAIEDLKERTFNELTMEEWMAQSKRYKEDGDRKREEERIKQEQEKEKIRERKTTEINTFKNTSKLSLPKSHLNVLKTMLTEIKEGSREPSLVTTENGKQLEVTFFRTYGSFEFSSPDKSIDLPGQTYGFLAREDTPQAKNKRYYALLGKLAILMNHGNTASIRALENTLEDLNEIVSQMEFDENLVEFNLSEVENYIEGMVEDIREDKEQKVAAVEEEVAEEKEPTNEPLYEKEFFTTEEDAELVMPQRYWTVLKAMDVLEKHEDLGGVTVVEGKIPNVQHVSIRRDSKGNFKVHSPDFELEPAELFTFMEDIVHREDIFHDELVDAIEGIRTIVENKVKEGVHEEHTLIEGKIGQIEHFKIEGKIYPEGKENKEGYIIEGRDDNGNYIKEGAVVERGNENKEGKFL